MAVISWIVIHERERVVVLNKLEAWDLLAHDLEKDAFGIGSHSFLPRIIIVICDQAPTP
jgi:hypothetical protein